MKNNISYTPKHLRAVSRLNGYWWKTPEETMEDEYGFCYDLSAFALYNLINSVHPNAKILFVCWGDWGRKSNTGDFASLFRRNGKYFSIDNGYLKGPFESLEYVLKSAARKRKIKSYRFFEYDEISFHTPYGAMAHY